MTEIGTVTNHSDSGTVTVSFEQLGFEAECLVPQPTTGDNNVFILPSKGTQVVCLLGERNIVLGAIYSDSEPVPQKADPLGEFRQAGGCRFAMSKDRFTVANDRGSLKNLLKEVLNIIKTITVSTPVGASGTPLPPTIQAIETASQNIDNLLSE